MEWKKVKLGEIVSLVIDYRGKTPLKLGGDWADSGYRAFSAKNIKTGKIVQEESIRFVDEELYRKWMKEEVKRGDIFITSEAPFGEIYYWNSDEKIVLSQRLFDIRLKDDVDSRYVYYYMTTNNFKGELDGRATGTTVIGLRQPELLRCEIPLPPLEDQRRIAAILSSLDAQIENNNRINANLEAQAQALFKSWFVDFEPWGGVMPEDWREGKAEDFYEINIGKTPPRKEKQWFSEKEGNIWVSIADMGNCGTFIGTSSEYLTNEAVHKFNILLVPKDTILLSFKLTIGRVAITNTNLTTNEAIARFVLPNICHREYLYLLLKDYDYNSLGSTSSIATAVNSKIIKAMKIVEPAETVLTDFHKRVGPIFDQIRNNTEANARLASLRDTLLPKLMKGEIEV